MKWSDVFKFVLSADISSIYQNPMITHNQFIEDLRLLETVFPNSYLNGTSGPGEIRLGISDLLNEHREGVGFYCKQIHAVAELIRVSNGIPGIDLLKKQLHSHRGFMNQLHATCYWLGVYGVDYVEHNFGSHDADIVSHYGAKLLKIHVKTIDQHEKSSRVFLAVCDIGSILRADSEKVDGISLGVAKFTGVVPPNITKEIWKEILKDVPRSPGVYSITIGKDHLVMLQLDYTNQGQIYGPDELWNLNYHRQEIENRIPDNDSDVNILLGVTTARVKDIALLNKKHLDNTKIDIEIFIEVHPLSLYNEICYSRSELFCKNEAHEICDYLSCSIPKEFRLRVIKGEHTHSNKFGN